MATISMTEMRQVWAAMMDLVLNRNERVVLTSRGVPVAAIINIDDLRKLNAMERGELDTKGTLK